MQQDAKTKGGTLGSGTSHKSGFHSDTPETHGMGSVGPNEAGMPGHKPQANPSKPAGKGHTIK